MRPTPFPPYPPTTTAASKEIAEDGQTIYRKTAFAGTAGPGTPSLKPTIRTPVEDCK